DQRLTAVSPASRVPTDPKSGAVARQLAPKVSREADIPTERDASKGRQRRLWDGVAYDGRKLDNTERIDWANEMAFSRETSASLWSFSHWIITTAPFVR